MQSVCRKVHLAAKGTCLEVRRPIAAISEPVENRSKIREEEYVGGSIARKVLLKPKITRFIAKVAWFEELMVCLLCVVVIGAGGKAIDRIDYQIKIIQQREAGPDWLCGRCKDRQKLIACDGLPFELPGGSAAQDDLLDAIGRIGDLQPPGLGSSPVRTGEGTGSPIDNFFKSFEG